MTTGQKRKIIAKVQRLEGDLSRLEDVRLRLASAEFASATLSAGGGSQSYTRADLSKVERTISSLKSQLAACRRLLAGECPALGRTIYFTYR